MKITDSDLHKEALRAAMLALAQGANRAVNPHDVVAHARDPASPFHKHFEWDDDVAADSYRLAQAGALIRYVKFDVVTRDPVTKAVKLTTTRAYQSRPSQRNRAGGYEHLEDLMADDDKRAELLHQVLKELSSYRKRYAALQELAEVWQAIDDSLDEYEPPKKDGAQDDDRPSV
jgi:hypothetical protein